MSNNNNTGATRATFATRLGAVAAAVGSAVGLGNIWRFPYETGQNGGAAFLIIYVLAVALLGIPLMTAEFVIGRSAHANVVGAFRKLAPGTWWHWIGVLTLITPCIILGFYVVIMGWTLDYSARAILNDFARVVAEAQAADPSVDAAQVLSDDFSAFITSVWQPFAWMIAALGITAFIMMAGVQKGIERASSLMMPLLALLLLFLVINSCFLDGFTAGIDFLFNPDWSKVTGHTIITALGQAFFSLSVAMGILMAYGSYMGDNTKIGKTAISVACLDTLIAILAGVVIFPACFTYGVQPGAGVGLVYITLPNVFLQMTGGYVFCVAFFLLILLAGLTSFMSIVEVPISFLQEEAHMSRRGAVVLSISLTFVLGMLCSMSLGVLSDVQICGCNLFDFSDKLTANYLMPIAGFFICIFVGWRLDRDIIRDALTNWRNDSGWYIRPLLWLLRIICPFLILVVFVGGLM